MVNVLIVPADDTRPMRHMDLDPTYQAASMCLNAHSLDNVFLPDTNGVLTNAHSKQYGGSVNARATQLVEFFVPGFALRDVITGDAVFVGFSIDSTAYPAIYTDVSHDVLAVADARFGARRLAPVA